MRPKHTVSVSFVESTDRSDPSSSQFSRLAGEREINDESYGLSMIPSRRVETSVDASHQSSTFGRTVPSRGRKDNFKH